jgi:hypothetical protein
MPISKITNEVKGITGFLHDIETKNDSVLIFQLPRETRMLSDIYVQQAKEALAGSLPAGRHALLIGCDVNIYEITGADAVAILLKGLIEPAHKF